MKQATLPDGGDEDVLASVVVVVSRGHTHPVHRHVEPRAGGDVFEPAVTRVPEHARRRRSAGGGSGPVGAVGQNDVLPAVVVDVHECGAGAKRFRQILSSRRSGVVREMKARRRRDVRQLETRGRRILRTGGRDERREQQTGGRPHVHGVSTSPFLTASSTSSAVLCTPSAFIRFVRCTETVFTLSPRIEAISLFDFPSAIRRST